MPSLLHVETLAADDVALITLTGLAAVLTTCGVIRAIFLVSRHPTIQAIPTPDLQTALNQTTQTPKENSSTLCSDTPIRPSVESTQSPSLNDARAELETASLATTASSDLSSLCSTSLDTHATSMTSLTIPTAVPDSEEEDDEDLEDLEDAEDIDYELKRAQTQSMEMKKGVLLSWSPSTFVQTDPPTPIPDLPSVVISESVSSLNALSSGNALSCDPTFLRPPKLCVSIVTHRSDASLLSTLSSVSIVLDQFPLPPDDTLAQLPVPSITEDEGSTLDQVITMYEA
ncbi:hypothetical protein VKT23_002111 [Stygiomarasmius scandens]|uniref:Uncharacterized protein n=1 Tax=Marasmiellus scandens TaxID=2682957 RepID=A0ABR1K3Q2_9AGAR